MKWCGLKVGGTNGRRESFMHMEKSFRQITNFLFSRVNHPEKMYDRHNRKYIDDFHPLVMTTSAKTKYNGNTVKID